MGEKTPKATHTGTLKIRNIRIPCAVLEGGTRLLSQSGFLVGIGRSRTPKGKTGATVAKVPTFLAAKNLKPYVSNELLSSTQPVKFKTDRGLISYGYPAEILPQVCEVFLKARDDGLLLPTQAHIADRCDILIRGLAHVGIIALVDEATGYQEVRDRLALEKILEKWIAKELLAWAKRFPDEFYRQMFRLRGWQYSPLTVKRPKVVGHYTNDIVYERLEVGVLEELRKRNPSDERGQRRARHHQWLTTDVGHPKLRDHLNGVIALMRASANWNKFYRLLNRAYPKKGTTLELPLDES